MITLKDWGMAHMISRVAIDASTPIFTSFCTMKTKNHLTLVFIDFELKMSVVLSLVNVDNDEIQSYPEFGFWW